MKLLLVSAALVSGLCSLSAQAVDCWGMSKPGDVIDCLARNSFSGDVNRAGAFYGQNYATYKKPALPVVDVKLVKYEQKAGTNNFALISNNGLPIGTLQQGGITVSLPPNMVAAGGGHLIGNDGSTLVATNANMAAAMSKQLDKNPPVASLNSKYSLQGLNDLRALKARSAGR